MTFYTYLSGQYLHFEDLLLIEEDDGFFEDGLRFISARYLVKDRGESGKEDHGSPQPAPEGFR